jgi:hypothetical protein
LGRIFHTSIGRKSNKNWFAACAEQMTFLPTKPKDYEQVKEQNGTLERHNGKLEALLEKLLERMSKD